MHLATLHEEHFLKADLAAKRLEQVLEIDPNNEEAYFKLERSYRKLRQWLDLINTYDRHIAATADRKTKVELYGAIAQVYADEVEDADRAIDAYKNIIDLDEQNVPALEALAKLYDKLGRRCAVDRLHDARRRADAGHASSASSRSTASARRSTRSSATASPRRSATRWRSTSIRRTSRRSRRCGRSRSTRRTTTRRRATSIRSRATRTSPRQRAKLLVELGKLRDEMLGDHASAVLAWEAAYEADGENEDAAMPLVDEYIAQGRVGAGRAAARDARPKERQARAERAARLAEQARAGLRGAGQGRQGPQGVHGGRTSSI